MSPLLLALIAAGGAGTVDPPPVDDPLPGVPWPTAQYFDSPLPPCTIDTSDGSGQAVHPGVVDFGATPFSGFRFWMANTPYPNSDVSLENPEVYGSHDGHDWVTPPGVTNPIDTYPAPGGTYWSDTDLLWDEDGARFILTYRAATPAFYARTSTDGINWSDRVLVHAPPTGGVSQSLVKTPEGKWRLYYQDGSARYVEADDALGPYGPEIVSPGLAGWHAHVMYDAPTGLYFAAAGNGARFARSTDGINWASKRLLISHNTYRPCLRRLDADTFHLWYSVGSGTPTVWSTRYTRVPESFLLAP